MPKDILLETFFKDGDLNVGYSDEQHIDNVMMSAPGHFKQHPLIGVDILQYVHAPMSPAVVRQLNRKIKLQIEADGGKQTKIDINPKTSTIYAKATYK